MVRCWALSLKERPSFTEIVHALGELPSDSKVWDDHNLPAPEGNFVPTPFPQNKDRNAGLLVSHISGKRVEEKTLFYMHFKQVGVWIRLLCYISGNALTFVWMASCEQCQEFTFALTAAWPSPSSPSLWFHCDLACLSAAAPSQRHFVSRSLTTSVPLPLHTHSLSHPDLQLLCRDVRYSALTGSDQ